MSIFNNDPLKQRMDQADAITEFASEIAEVTVGVYRQVRREFIEKGMPEDFADECAKRTAMEFVPRAIREGANDCDRVHGVDACVVGVRVGGCDQRVQVA